MRPRVIPVLLLDDGYLVKTTRYRDPRYVGDPINTVKIFNDKGADELVILDIGATRMGATLNLRTLENIVSEAFMPIAYGGGVRHSREADQILRLGVGKIVLNSALFNTARIVEDVAGEHGSQAVVASVDVGRPRFARLDRVVRDSGRRAVDVPPATWCRELERRGVGEILLTDIRREGARTGYNYDLIASVSRQVSVPVIANGGSGDTEHFRMAVLAGASAVAAGTQFIFHGSRKAVLINYPNDDELTTVFSGDQ